MRTKGATDKKPRKRAGYYIYQEKKRQEKKAIESKVVSDGIRD